MSDDLVKQLQTPRPMSMFLTRADQAKDWTELLHTAADRISELEAKLAQQDDLVQAAVAAALTEAAQATNAWVRRAMHLSSDGYEIERTHGHMAQEATNAILALITPDAQAALDRVKAKERERCARVAANYSNCCCGGESRCMSEYDCLVEAETSKAIAAAIREGGE